MTTDIVVIDNFIPKRQFDVIKHYFTYTCQWLYAPTVLPVNDPRTNPNDLTDQQFVNVLFYAYQGVRNQKGMDIMMPVLERLKVTIVARIKANLQVWTPEVREREFHVDYDYGNMTAIYYLNTCNGYTLFQDGQKCESVENRICIFPGSKWHCGTTTSNTKNRMVVNINYWPNRPESGQPNLDQIIGDLDKT